MLASLGEGWDGKSAKAPGAQTIAFVSQQIIRLQQSGFPAPTINPSADGAIYVEWHDCDLDIEIVFERPYVVFAIADDIRKEMASLDAEGDSIDIANLALQTLHTRSQA
jgi:hypothetical protein